MTQAIQIYIDSKEQDEKAASVSIIMSTTFQSFHSNHLSFIVDHFFRPIRTLLGPCKALKFIVENFDNNNETDDNQTNDTEIDDTEVIINQNFELKWSVESFNKQILDYNILKPFLSDYYVKLALSAHLKANGPNLIDGVEYKRKVQ